MDANGFPETLHEAITYFADPDVAVAFVRDIRWPNGVECPACGSTDVLYLANQRRWKCRNKHPKQQFSVKNGTIFEESPVGLDKWLPAMWLVTNCKNGISSYEIARDLGVTQKTAWFMDHRIRLAMRAKSFDTKLCGEVEADETFVGGKVRNMHKRSKRLMKANREGNWGKTIVLGLLERNGQVRAMVAPNRQERHIHSHVRANVEFGSHLYTDEPAAYKNLSEEFTHSFVDHISKYVDSEIHTNGLEIFGGC
jgi:transposase-like protein